jgi:hypothetical protein
MKIRARIYRHGAYRLSRGFVVESFGSGPYWFRYVWFGRACVYVRTARP